MPRWSELDLYAQNIVNPLADTDDSQDGQLEFRYSPLLSEFVELFPHKACFETIDVIFDRFRPDTIYKLLYDKIKSLYFNNINEDEVGYVVHSLKNLAEFVKDIDIDDYSSVLTIAKTMFRDTDFYSKQGVIRLVGDFLGLSLEESEGS